VLCVGGAFSASVVLSTQQATTASEATSQLKAASYFYIDYLRESLVLARTGDQIGFLLSTGAEVSDMLEELEVLETSVANIYVLLARLEKSQKRAKRRAPSLRLTDNKFDTFRRSIEAVLELTESYMDLFLVDPVEALELLQEVEIFDVGNEGFDGQRSELDENLRDYYHRLSRVDRGVRSTTYRVSIIAFFLTCFAMVVLLLTMLRVVKAGYEKREAEAKLEAQEKLMRQQSHEMRSRFAPSIVMMDTFLEARSLDDFQGLKNDMHSALILLKEIEVQHQTRLDCYKIMRGNYEVKDEVIDLLVFLHERTCSERTIAAAKARSEGRALDVKFRVGVPSSLAAATSVSVRTDAYILSHVMTNLLSNARKHCHVGHVTALFHGEDGAGRLVFRVADSGVGVPEKIRTQLFKREVTTGADVRGTGLGMASAGLFCETAEGFIRLVGTQLQNAQGRGGWTLFEFGIKGTLLNQSSSPTSAPRQAEEYHTVDADANLPWQTTDDDDVDDHHHRDKNDTNVVNLPDLPDGVRVIIVDDSALNRLCVCKSLQKIQSTEGAKDWTYSHFETIEASQPTLRAAADDRNVVVTLDQHLNSRGGVMTGTDAVKWLHTINFKGVVVSVTGDDTDSVDHLNLGAAFAWGKPLPSVDKMKADLRTTFGQCRAIGVGKD